MPSRPRTLRLPLAAALAGVLAAPLLVASPGAATTGADPLDDVLGSRDAARRIDPNFKVGTLNVLGSQHTRGGDFRRTVRTARLIRRKRIRLVALQEVQQDQYRWLNRRLKGFRFWPGTRLDAAGIRLQIGWRRSRFDQLDHGTITTTFSHQQRPIPWVRLRERDTGRNVYVIDIHNSPQDQERARDTATRREIRLFERLRSRGGTVLMLGDANERREWFCRVTGHTDARSASGGRHTRRGCYPPDRMYVDWLMGGGRRFEWRHYRAQDVRVSDHRLHTAVFRWHGV